MLPVCKYCQGHDRRKHGGAHKKVLVLLKGHAGSECEIFIKISSWVIVNHHNFVVSVNSLSFIVTLSGGSRNDRAGNQRSCGKVESVDVSGD
jgi:hypothetical protein